MNQLVPIAPHEPRPVDLYRMSTDAAEVCKGIVTASATTIQGRRFVSVEGWQAIAIAHGCAAGARDVERVDGGVRAVGEVRRMSDGQLIAQAEGFVGEDEETWFGGKNKWGKELPKRNDYAIRAMAQTRAISRACRSAFAHVVVMMNAGLSTTPAEEVPPGGFDAAPYNPQTGEVLEVEARTVAEPAARQKLEGPCTSATALKTALKQFVRSLEGCGDIADLDALLADPDTAAILGQCERDLPDWWKGGPSVNHLDNFEPLEKRIATKRRELDDLSAENNRANANMGVGQ